jgi:hypothetical protein
MCRHFIFFANQSKIACCEFVQDSGCSCCAKVTVQTQPANTFADAMADICCKESLLVTIEGGATGFHLLQSAKE